ncbi:XdhB: predicted xanthine dehydrogenase YagS FAD-binding subunit [Desulfosarcina variabilis str. Montpellier]|uniref:FAD binding domain-containing protein n=1 Tax=Desulfosarcina variabilis TaxID=2300 RepID=UPI003AFB1D7A
MLPSFAYIRVKSLDQAIEALSVDGARLLAGGTDLIGCLRDGVLEATTIVSISRLAELHGVRRTAEGGLVIGALESIADVARHPIIQSEYQALAMAAETVASPQLRHQGTLGGNLCQKPRCAYYRGEFDCLRKGGDLCYAESGENTRHCIIGGENCYYVHPSDTAPALVALGASVVLVGPKGKRVLPLERFYLSSSEDYTRETVLNGDEILTAIHLPPHAGTLQSTYRKVRIRGAWDFALAGAAIAAQRKNGRVIHSRIVLSGAAPVPFRATASEAVLAGNPLDPDTIVNAAQAAMQNAEPLAQNSYKIPMFKGVIEQCLSAMALKRG